MPKHDPIEDLIRGLMSLMRDTIPSDTITTASRGRGPNSEIEKRLLDLIRSGFVQDTLLSTTESPQFLAGGHAGEEYFGSALYNPPRVILYDAVGRASPRQQRRVVSHEIGHIEQSTGDVPDYIVNSLLRSYRKTQERYKELPQDERPYALTAFSEYFSEVYSNAHALLNRLGEVESNKEAMEIIRIVDNSLPGTALLAREFANREDSPYEDHIISQPIFGLLIGLLKSTGMEREF